MKYELHWPSLRLGDLAKDMHACIKCMPKFCVSSWAEGKWSLQHESEKCVHAWCMPSCCTGVCQNTPAAQLRGRCPACCRHHVPPADAGAELLRAVHTRLHARARHLRLRQEDLPQPAQAVSMVSCECTCIRHAESQCSEHDLYSLLHAAVARARRSSCAWEALGRPCWRSRTPLRLCWASGQYEHKLRMSEHACAAQRVTAD